VILAGFAALRVARETTAPFAVRTTIESGNAVTPWSNITDTLVGVRSSRSRYDGCVLTTLACANADAGATSAASDARRINARLIGAGFPRVEKGAQTPVRRPGRCRASRTP
jgi:hypothetical protein